MLQHHSSQGFSLFEFVLSVLFVSSLLTLCVAYSESLLSKIDLEQILVAEILGSRLQVNAYLHQNEVVFQAVEAPLLLEKIRKLLWQFLEVRPNVEIFSFSLALFEVKDASTSILASAGTNVSMEAIWASLPQAELAAFGLVPLEISLTNSNEIPRYYFYINIHLDFAWMHSFDVLITRIFPIRHRLQWA